jgi:hypothetical protein
MITVEETVAKKFKIKIITKSGATYDLSAVAETIEEAKKALIADIDDARQQLLTKKL